MSFFLPYSANTTFSGFLGLAGKNSWQIPEFGLDKAKAPRAALEYRQEEIWTETGLIAGASGSGADPKGGSTPIYYSTKSVLTPVFLMRDSPRPAFERRDPLKGLETPKKESKVARVSTKIQY